MLWTGAGPGMPVKALICIPQGVSWMLGLTQCVNPGLLFVVEAL